jgi:hypothetical protein
MRKLQDVKVKDLVDACQRCKSRKAGRMKAPRLALGSQYFSGAERSTFDNS